MEGETSLSNNEKLQFFWNDKPELWFAQLESQFKLANITVDSTKFYYVVSSLGSDDLTGSDDLDLTCVSDIVLNIPDSEAYTQIKTRLIAQNADSESSRLKKLLSGIELGDKKPSKLLYEMQSLAADKISSEVLKNLWLQRLPLQIRQILSISKDNVQSLAKMADSVFEISNEDAVTSVSFNVESQGFQNIEKRLTAIEQRLSKIEIRHRSSSRGKEVRKSINRKYCWWHFKFGNKASKCQQPCTFGSEN
nr:uncharacterized protein LOC122270194 [Parasteatoda tepidariorum]